MRLPNFVIIGAAKSGTTTLYAQLMDDDAFYLPDLKEPEYFSRDDQFSKGIDWYERLFENAGDNQICGEASTTYTLSPLFPHAAERMHQCIPEAKLIYVVREPVSRSFSFYTQLVKSYQNYHRTTSIPMSYEDLLFSEFETTNTNSENLAEFQGYLPYCSQLLTAGGMYFEQLQAYLKYYQKEAIHCLLFEDFISDPYSEIEKIYAFLDMDFGKQREEFSLHRKNISDDHFKNKYSAEIINKYTGVPVLGTLLRRLPENMKSALRQLARNKATENIDTTEFKIPKMKPETRVHLTEMYKKPNKALSTYLGRDLTSVWNLS